MRESVENAPSDEENDDVSKQRKFHEKFLKNSTIIL